MKFCRFGSLRMSDPRKNVMSELAQQKSKLLQGQSLPRGQQFSGRVSVNLRFHWKLFRHLIHPKWFSSRNLFVKSPILIYSGPARNSSGGHLHDENGFQMGKHLFASHPAHGQGRSFDWATRNWLHLNIISSAFFGGSSTTIVQDHFLGNSKM